MMSEYKLFVKEKEQMDALVEAGYLITDITENVNGSFVEFSLGKKETESLHIVTPEGRKYFAVVLIKQQQAGA